MLTHRFLIQKQRAPSREALNVALDTIMARCCMGPKVDVPVRFARSRDAIYLDLCNDQWNAIQITADGWRVMDNPQVMFRRGAGARPLPVPTKGGTLNALRPLLNAGDDSQWCLMMSGLWVLFTARGVQPFGAERWTGQRQSKHVTGIAKPVGPIGRGLYSPPKDETDATVSAMHAGILAYDNLSGCRAELADVFCRFSTGQGYRTRTFYENLGVTVASVKLPIMLNGIDATVYAGGLAGTVHHAEVAAGDIEDPADRKGIWVTLPPFTRPALVPCWMPSALACGTFRTPR